MARPGLRGRNPGPQRLQASGFTLLEIMVVVVIIGIIATIATLSVGVTSRDQGIDREIRRIQDLLALVSEQAVLQGREYGLTFYAHEYGFSAYDYGIGRWEPLLDDPVQWNRAGIDRAIDTLKTQTVMLPRPVPLLLAYWTVDLREDGRVGFRPDVYRRDPPLLAALARPRVSPWLPAAATLP